MCLNGNCSGRSQKKYVRRRRRRRFPYYKSSSTKVRVTPNRRREYFTAPKPKAVKRPTYTRDYPVYELSKRRRDNGFRNGRYFTLPYQNYAGPGNTNFHLPIKNRLDAWAFNHDTKYSGQGITPYITWSPADEQLLQSVESPRTLNEYITKGYFSLKKKLVGSK